MNPLDSPPRPLSHRGIRAFDLVLTILTGLLVLGTALAVPLLALVATGHGSLTLDAELDPPYSVGLSGDRSVQVGDSGAEFTGFPRNGDTSPFRDAPVVRFDAAVARDDTDTRAVLVAFVVATIALAWLGLVNLRRIVRSTRSGRPFDARNAVRLRWLAVAVLVFPVVGFAVRWAMTETLDTDVALRVTTTGPSWWILLVIGVGLLALAEIFRAGADLEELERGTI